MVESMRPGSVIVDLAAEQGGNCELTAPGQVVVKHGVTLIGYTDLPSRLARQASSLYATNLLRLMEELCPQRDGRIHVRMDDEMIRGTTVILDGAITWPPPPLAVSTSGKAAPAASGPATAAKPAPPSSVWTRAATPVIIIAAGLLFLWVGAYAPPAFLAHFTVFVLSCFLGYLVVWNVTPSLHTPLMSVTNVISSIITIGALVQMSSVAPPVTILAGIAIVLTSVNMAGGYWVTRRMLAMFRK
jgi:NAD(P) transhydrogenase subunit alpha